MSIPVPYAWDMDEPGILEHVLGVSGILFGFTLMLVHFVRQYRAGDLFGDSPEPLSELPIERQKVLRKRVREQQIDPPEDLAEVRVMAEWMRAERRDLFLPAGLLSVMTTIAITTPDRWTYIFFTVFLLLVSVKVVIAARRTWAGSAFLRRYPAS